MPSHSSFSLHCGSGKNVGQSDVDEAELAGFIHQAWPVLLEQSGNVEYIKVSTYKRSHSPSLMNGEGVQYLNFHP